MPGWSTSLTTISSTSSTTSKVQDEVDDLIQLKQVNFIFYDDLEEEQGEKLPQAGREDQGGPDVVTPRHPRSPAA